MSSPHASRIRCVESTITVVANRNTAPPSISITFVPRRAPTIRSLPCAPSAPSSTPNTVSGTASADSTQAPAPSPNRMQVARSSQSSTFESVSAPTTSTCSARPDWIWRDGVHHRVDPARAGGRDVVRPPRRARRRDRRSWRRSTGSSCRASTSRRPRSRSRRARCPERSSACCAAARPRSEANSSVAGDAPLVDAGALADPRVAGVDPRRDLVVRDDPLGDGRADRDDARASSAARRSRRRLLEQTEREHRRAPPARRRR